MFDDRDDRLEKNRARFHSVLAIPVPRNKKERRLLEKSLCFRTKRKNHDSEIFGESRKKEN